MNSFLSRFSLCAALAATSLLPLQAQLRVPEPVPAYADQPISLPADNPMQSLADQLEVAAFEQRTALAAALPEAERAVDGRIAELRSRGLVLADEAETNLAAVRTQATDIFRYLSFASAETWESSRHNAALIVRKIQRALDDLARTAAQPRP